MKTLLNTITQDEKKRILEMHKNATKRNYLQEQGNPIPGSQSTQSSEGHTIRDLRNNEVLYKKFITLDDDDQNKIREFFTHQTGQDWKGITPFPLIGIIQESLVKYANAGATPDQIPFLETSKKTSRAQSKYVDPKTGAAGSSSNYDVIFSPNSPYKLIQIADSAFKKFFNYKLNKAFS
jgi:hypothetical protein